MSRAGDVETRDRASTGRSATEVRLEHLRTEVCVDLEAWGERYPVFSPARFPGLALTVAAHLPDCSGEVRSLASLVSLWIAAFDELVDEARITEPAVHAVTDRYKACVRDALTQTSHTETELRVSRYRDLDPTVQLYEALEEIGREVAACKPAKPLVEYWVHTFQRMVDGIVAQRELGAKLYAEAPGEQEGGGLLLPACYVPTYDSLMGTLTDSIGVPFYLATCFVAYQDTNLVDRIAEIVPAVEACAKAIRLANDLQSWGRDVRERNVNTLVAVSAEIARANSGLSPIECQTRSIRVLEERLKCEMSRVQSLLAASPLPGGRPERGIARLLEFVTAFYAASDYHIYRSE